MTRWPLLPPLLLLASCSGAPAASPASAVPATSAPATPPPVASAALAAVTERPADPRRLPGEVGQWGHIHHAVFFRDRLWVAAAQPELWAVDLASGKATGWQFDAPVATLLRTRDGRLFALSSSPRKAGLLSLWEGQGEGWRHVRSWRTTKASELQMLIETGEEVGVIDATHARFVSRAGEVREVAFERPIRGFHHASAAMGGATLYVGLNEGEFGGGLWRIDLTTGHIIEARGNATNVSPVSDKICEMHLDHECSPVTAVVADMERPGCVLASVGLNHMGFAHGALHRVCGASFERVWRELPDVCHQQKDSWREYCEMQEAPVWDVLPAPGGFWASTGNGIVRDQGGKRMVWEQLKVEQVGGLSLSRSVPGLILLMTSMQSRVSVGGGGPLLVPLGEPQGPRGGLAASR